MGKYQTNCTLSYRANINNELIIVRVKPDSRQPLEFEPGQYLELALIEGAPGVAHDPFQDNSTDTVLRRQYSIASTAGSSEELELYIVLVPHGVLTPRLFELPLGARLWVNPKVKGKFTLEHIPQEPKDLVMVCTGTGLAPFISMYRTYRNSAKWRRFNIVHGARFARDLGYRQELEQAMQDDPSFFYIPTVTRHDSNSVWTGHHGRVHSVFGDQTYETVVKAACVPDSCQVFLCGNPEMIDSLQGFLEQLGFKLHKKKEPGQIHVEKYW